MDKVYKASALMVRDRILDLPDMYYPLQLPLIYKEIMSLLREMVSKGGVLVLPYDKGLDRAARICLGYLSGRMRQMKVLTQYDCIGQEKDIPLPESGTVCWLVHDSFLSGHLDGRLERWLQPGRAAVVSTKSKDFSRMLFRFPSRVSHAVNSQGRAYLEEFQNEFPQEVSEDLNEASTNSDLLTLFSRVSAIDQWGVPVPADLMKEACSDLEANFDQLLDQARERMLVFPTFDSTDMLTTKGPPWAEDYVRLSGFECISFYEHIFSLINGSKREHLKCVLLLLTAWLSKRNQGTEFKSKIFPTKKRILEFFQQVWPEVEKQNLAQIGRYQAVDWAQVAAELSEFQKAIQVIDSALHFFDRHPYIVHQKAHLCLTMANNTEAMDDVRQAGRAIKEAVQDLPGNVYALHSQGIFEGRFGKKQKAMENFYQALNIQPWNSYIRVAMADLLLDMGEYDQVRQYIEEAYKYDSFSLCLDHLRGRLEYCLGKWEQAEHIWTSMLEKYNDNIYALQSLGHMFRKRGKWGLALTWLDRAFHCDSENSAVLLECSLVLSDLAQLTEIKGNDVPDPGTISAILRTHFAKYHGLSDLGRAVSLRSAALFLIKASLINDPLNIRLKIQEVLQAIKLNNLDEADEYLKRLEHTHQGNAHLAAARALWHEKKGHLEQAISQFKKAAELDKTNPESRLHVARITYRLKGSEKAIGILNDFIRQFEQIEQEIPASSRNALLVEYAGVARHIQDGLKMSSSEALERAWKIDPANPWITVYEQQFKA